MRNVIAHEYEEDIEHLCESLNKLIGKCEVLLKYWQSAQEYINEKHLCSYDN